MLIKNTTASIFGSHLTLGDKRRELVTLKPGVNDVAPEVWAKFAALGTVQHAIEAGHLVELGRTLPAAAKAEVKITDLPVKDAARLVEQTVDRALLEKWIEQEERAGVLKVLERQIDKVTVKGKGDEDQGDEGDEEPEA